MVTLCSHLFWVGKQGGSRQHRDARRVLECLQRAVQIADDMCMAASTHVDLFIEILNHYLYHFESENEVRTSVALTSPPVECTLTFAWLFVPPIFCFLPPRCMNGWLSAGDNGEVHKRVAGSDPRAPGQHGGVGAAERSRGALPQHTGPHTAHEGGRGHEGKVRVNCHPWRGAQGCCLGFFFLNTPLKRGRCRLSCVVLTQKEAARCLCVGNLRWDL